MKLLAETTGPFMLIDSALNQEIPANRPAVITSSAFTNRFAATNQLRIIVSDLPDEASDKDFAKFWAECEGDHDLAVESFTSQFTDQAPEPEPKDETKPAPKRRTSRKKKAE